MHRVVLVFLGLLACGDGSVVYPEDCSDLSPRDAIACGKERFWEAHTSAYERRVEVHDLLGRLVAEIPEGVDDAGLAELYFWRGALGIGLVLEHGVDRSATIVPDLREAVRLAPENGKIPSWVDSMELVIAFGRGDDEEVARVAARLEANVELYPVGNILSITGTMSGLPLASGLPQRAVEMLDTWECTEAWCARNTERAPYSQPGLHVHFADAYARVGDRDKTREHLEAALVAEGADSWPYRDFAENHLADLDGYLASFAELGEEGSAVALVYANSPQGCTLCHGTRRLD
ncbi:MAG: hypothetical protein H6720_27355 [Sandaracinus sp.]|nr:hypothetical protein [Sandaracinus sp.]